NINQKLKLIRFSVISPVISPVGPFSFCPGGGVQLTSSEKGLHQWYRNDTLIAGAIDTVLTATKAGSYKVWVSNSKGCGISTIVAVTTTNISTPPLSINIIPNGPLAICNGTITILSSKLSDLAQWYKNDIPIPGAINSTYVVSDSGSYKVFSSNANQCGFSPPVLVNVNKPSKPRINWTSNYYLSTTPGYTHYEWLLNGVAISGIDSSSYKPLITGVYKVTITDNNGCKNTSDSYNHISLPTTELTIGDIKLHYYPNPAQFVLNIDVLNAGNKKLDAIFYDVNGRLVQKILLSQGSNQLLLDKIPFGLYQLVIRSSLEKTAIKISVIR
ncbi:MAG: T9SS type A sorting domain-containing protein, partial [Saprospiraceae bacterium]